MILSEINKENKIWWKATNLIFLKEASKKSSFYTVPIFYPSKDLEDFIKIWTKLNPAKKYAVRSSGTSEDSNETSMAGQFRTHLDVSIKDIPRAIRDIQQHSWDKTGEIIPIVVQEMVVDIQLSGIAFSHDVDSDTPYSVIQVHNGIGEEIVWGQITGDTYKIMNGIPDQKWEIERYVPAEFRKIYQAIQELRPLYHTPYFDIEFSINKNGELYILQIRPLTTTANKPNKLTPLTYRYARMITHKLQSGNQILGDMIDINPRELVGSEPRLIQSMFQYLFADSAIPLTRKEMGYQVDPTSKMTSTINGNLYVNLETDLRAFLPADLPEEDTIKFVDHYSRLLESNPDTQDRLDSELYPLSKDSALSVISSIYPDSRDRKRVLQYFLNLFEGLELFLSGKKNSYPELENNLLNQFGAESYFELIWIQDLPNHNVNSLIALALRISKEFAFYARWAFYYSQIETSNSALFNKLLYQRDIQEGLEQQGLNTIRFKQIQGFNLLKTFNTEFSKKNWPFPLQENEKLTNNKVELFLAARENLKFILMRALFFLWEKIKAEEWEDIKDRDFSHFLWNKRNLQVQTKTNMRLNLPGVLSRESTPLFYKVSNWNGYFIGHDSLEGELIYIDDISEIGWLSEDITGKIILIDHATPEIDGALIYVKGVITRVGGPLAHIAIRAREMKIPSVVWVGAKFDELKKKKSVRIDFSNKKIYAT